MILPHLERILKLLMKSGRMNPNEHERQVAREMADRLMAKHGVTIEQMRALYWEWSGRTPPGGLEASRAPRRASTPRRTGEWDRRSRVPPWVVPRAQKQGEGRRTSILRRVEEAVAAAFPVGGKVAETSLAAFQSALKAFGVRCVPHHNSLLLRAYNYLQVVKVGFLVDDNPDSYVLGGRIHIGLDRLRRLGLAVDPWSEADQAAALVGCAGLWLPGDQHALKVPVRHGMEDLQAAVDVALPGDAAVDLLPFLERLRGVGVSMEIQKPECLLSGEVPWVGFRKGEVSAGGGVLGAAYDWPGLMARRLRVDPGDPRQMKVLKGLRPN